VTSIIYNILYAIDAFETIRFFDKIKYICRFFFLFFFGKISCKIFKSENKPIPSRSKKIIRF
jgi:hypothetical protein